MIVIDVRVSQLLGLILQKRVEVVERLQVPVQVGEPFDKKHNEIIALQEQALLYAAELVRLIGEEEAQKQWDILGRIAYHLA